MRALHAHFGHFYYYRAQRERRTSVGSVVIQIKTSGPLYEQGLDFLDQDEFEEVLNFLILLFLGLKVFHLFNRRERGLQERIWGESKSDS